MSVYFAAYTYLFVKQYMYAQLSLLYLDFLAFLTSLMKLEINLIFSLFSPRSNPTGLDDRYLKPSAAPGVEMASKETPRSVGGGILRANASEGSLLPSNVPLRHPSASEEPRSQPPPHPKGKLITETLVSLDV